MVDHGQAVGIVEKTLAVAKETVITNYNVGVNTNLFPNSIIPMIHVSQHRI